MAAAVAVANSFTAPKGKAEIVQFDARLLTTAAAVVEAAELGTVAGFAVAGDPGRIAKSLCYSGGPPVGYRIATGLEREALL